MARRGPRLRQPNGRPIDKKTDYNDWARLLTAAGVRRVRLHDGRHTAATLLLGENVRPRVVLELLGHVSAGGGVVRCFRREDRAMTAKGCPALRRGCSRCTPMRASGLVR
jgi:integrase